MSLLDQIRAERAFRHREDPIRRAILGLTPAQRYYLKSTRREKVLEGGNQSGKTWVQCVDFLAQAVGIHPTRHLQRTAEIQAAISRGEPVWRGWYSTTTYELFAEQAWGHWKSLLLYPGEDLPFKAGGGRSGHAMHPTRRILAIGWDTKNPERPKYLRLRRDDGGTAECFIKSYEQGRGEFQSAEVDRLALDEECSDDIYEEAQPRVIRRDGQIGIAATPVLGVRWLEDLRVKAAGGDPDVYHGRLSTLDNPCLPAAEIARLHKRYEGWPAGFRLRVEGFPLAEEGRVYPDSLFRASEGRVVKPFRLGSDWVKYRCIDHGVGVCACLWIAVAPGRKKIVLYREYYGEDVEPTVGVYRTGRGEDVTEAAGNAGAIGRLSRMDGGEQAYLRADIDRATLGRGQETGKRLIDLWLEGGIRVSPCPDNRVEPGIESVKRLLAERAPDGSPLLVVFDGLTRFLEERRLYERQAIRDRGDEGQQRPVKRADHLMDCWRYLVAGGLEWEPVPAPLPPAGTLGRRLVERRRKALKKRARI